MLCMSGYKVKFLCEGTHIISPEFEHNNKGTYEHNNKGTYQHWQYRSGTVNSKSFVGKVLLRIKWKFELTYAL